MCDLYGFTGNDLTVISKELENVLGISFELHESLFRGGDYYYYRTGTPWEVELILQRNAELEDEIAEPDFSEYEVLFYACASDMSRQRQFRDQIIATLGNQVKLLRSEE